MKENALTESEFKFIKEIVCNNAPDNLVEHYIRSCKEYGFNPFLKHGYLVKMGDTYAFIASIQKLRSIAMESGQYAGRTENIFFDQNYNKFNEWIFDYPPTLCKIGIYRKGIETPFYGTAKFSEFNKGNKFWRDMPSTMLAKVAESIALRLAFPDYIHNVYSEDEMPSFDNRNPFNIQIENAIPTPNTNEITNEIDKLVSEIKETLRWHPMKDIVKKSNEYLEKNSTNFNNLLKLKQRINDTLSSFLEIINKLEAVQSIDELEYFYQTLEAIYKADTDINNVYQLVKSKLNIL